MNYKFSEFNKNIEKIVNKNKLFLFYGENNYSMLETINNFVKNLKTAEKEILYGWEIDVDDIIRKLSTLSLFSQKTCVVVRYLNLAKNLVKKRLIEFLQIYNGENYLFLLYEDKMSPKDKFGPNFDWLFKNICCVEFVNPTKDEIINIFIPQKLKYINLTEGAKELICENFDNNLWMILNELEKLQYYVGDKKTISEKDILKYSIECHTAKIEELVNSVINNNLSRSLHILSKLLLEGMEETKIISALYRFFRKHFNYKKLPLEKIYKIIKELQTADSRIKTSVNKRYIVENCIINLVSIYNS